MKGSTLDMLNINEKGKVVAVELGSALQRRMLDLGLVAGTEVECVGKSPSGDPSAYLIRGAVIAMRSEDARQVAIEVACGRDKDGSY